ncbi:hypothetical protein GCM10020229_39040 [Kitasatospora albolonga]|uniref:universal stress protein n=1 Tax=Kitasatospora albolonga TaxID=68173 RepID=UPI0031E82EAC
MDGYSIDGQRKQRIVVGVSGSLGSLAALHRAAAEARRTDRELLAVLAWLPQGGEHGYRLAPCPPLLQVWEERAAARLTEALDAAFGGAPTVRLTSHALRGETGQVLVRVADRPDDLLVVGTGTGGWLRRGLRPSVTAYCIKRATCPVLTVPKPGSPARSPASAPWWSSRCTPSPGSPGTR